MRTLVVILLYFSVAATIWPWSPRKITSATKGPRVREKIEYDRGTIFLPDLRGLFTAGPREKRHNDDRWMVDVAYNERRDQWYKYDCRKVCYLEECRGTQGGTFRGFDCFKPAEHNVRQYHLNDGWHKLLTCKSTSDTDYVVLSADKKGTPVTIGAGSASRMIRCNDRGKWVTKTDRGKEVEVKNAFCYIVPKVEL
ncbi:hypothetical protein Aduo_017856 [Ancylostoma duodenale]